MRTIVMPDPERFARMTTAELRQSFLIETLFTPGKIELVYADVDRTVIGGVMPAAAPLTLGTDDSLRSDYFTQRRELGILNIGGHGKITVGGTAHEMEHLDCLYIGRGNPDITLASADAHHPAKFYLLSYPAHSSYPVVQSRKSHAQAVKLGSELTCNKRTIYKYIHPDGIQSCQLVMGFTELDVGSAWNTMPPHTHLRRSEVYMYFQLAPEHRVFHFMGPGDQTRNVIVADGQAIISPAWSIHAGVGTSRYSFCWGMGGENQVFDDMDGIAIADLK